MSRVFLFALHQDEMVKRRSDLRAAAIASFPGIYYCVFLLLALLPKLQPPLPYVFAMGCGALYIMPFGLLGGFVVSISQWRKNPYMIFALISNIIGVAAFATAIAYLQSQSHKPSGLVGP